MAGISDLLTVSKITGGAGPGAAAGAIGKINTTAGSIFNAVAGTSAVINSVKSLFGGGEEYQSSGNVSSINQLRSYLTKTDILSNNLFYVRFGGLGDIARDLSLLCHSASLPGVGFGTTEVRRHGFGVAEKVPTIPLFTDTTLSFIGDGKGDVRNFFVKWMNNIIRFNEHASMPFGAKGMTGPFEVSYKSQYTCQIEIVVVNRTNQEIFVVTLNDAYPIALGDQSLSWHDNDSLMSIPVTFTYYNWTAQVIEVPSGGDISNNPSLINQLVKVGTAVQTLATIKKPRSIGDIVNVTKNASLAVSGLKGFF